MTRPRLLTVVKLTTLAVALAVLTGFLGAWWGFELVSHFRAQYLGLALLCAGLAAYRRAWRWTSLALLCVALTTPDIVSWYVPRAPRADRSRDVRLLLSNVNAENTRYAGLLDLVRAERPDVVVVQEVSWAWARELETLASAYPYRKMTSHLGGRGMAVLSALPFEDVSIAYLGRHTPSVVFPTIVAGISVRGQRVTLVTTHPASPVIPRWFRSRNAQLDGIHRFVQGVKGPRIVMGDLNMTPWSPYYTRLVQETGLVDARRGFGLLPTWPTPLVIGSVGIPIDHCLISPELQVVGIRTGPSVHSDHLPLIVDLALRPATALVN